MELISTGTKLKNSLGLKNLKYVSFVRIIKSPHKILIVFYDSNRSDMPMTTSSIIRYSNQFSTRTFPFDHSGPLTPLLPLEEFKGDLRTAIVLTFDISGRYGNKNKQVNESTQRFETSQYFNEWVTLQDLTSPEAISSFTKRTRAERNHAVKAENRTAKLEGCIINDDGSVTFKFKTTATTPIYPKDNIFMKANPANNFALEYNGEKIYHMDIKILDFMKWLKETRPNYMEAQKISWKEIKDVIEVASIQLYSDMPSFHWQGSNWWLSQLDGSIYPTDIEPKVWNSPSLHGDSGNFLSKDLVGLIKGFKFWYNPMGKMLQKQMKEKELL